MSKSCVHWIPVTTGLPAQADVSMLVVLRAPDNTKEFDPEDRWMCFGTFDPGSGWSGDWVDYLGDDFVVTHWSPRPQFPEDNG
jgi:hypothetical protein